MDRRGDIGTLDKQIETLMQREKLSEDEVKALCEKVRTKKISKKGIWGKRTSPFLFFVYEVSAHILQTELHPAKPLK